MYGAGGGETPTDTKDTQGRSQRDEPQPRSAEAPPALVSCHRVTSIPWQAPQACPPHSWVCGLVGGALWNHKLYPLCFLFFWRQQAARASPSQGDRSRARPTRRCAKRAFAGRAQGPYGVWSPRTAPGNKGLWPRQRSRPRSSQRTQGAVTSSLYRSSKEKLHKGGGSGLKSSYGAMFTRRVNCFKRPLPRGMSDANLGQMNKEMRGGGAPRLSTWRSRKAERSPAQRPQLSPRGVIKGPGASGTARPPSATPVWPGSRSTVIGREDAQHKRIAFRENC